VHVAIGTDQRRDADARAADVLYEIAEDGKTGDDVDRILRACGARDSGQRETDYPTDKPRFASLLYKN
jgi:hypothetical protein